MNYLKTSLKLLLLLFSILISTLILLIVLIFLYPQLVINPKNIAWANKNFLNPQYNISWSTLSIKFERESLFKRKMHIQAKHLCFNLSEKELEPCLKNLDLLMDYDRARTPFYGVWIQTLKAELAPLEVDLKKFPEDPEPPTPFQIFKSIHPWPQRIRTLLTDIPMSEIEVQAESLEVILRDGSQLKASGHLINHKEPAYLGLDVKGQFQALKEAPHDFDVQVVMNPQAESDHLLLMNGKWSNQKIGEAQVAAQMTVDKESYGLTAVLLPKIKFEKTAKLSPEIRLQSYVTEKQFNASLDLASPLPFDPLKGIRLQNCSLQRNGDAPLNQDSPIKLSCPVEISLAFEPLVKVKYEKACGCVLPPALRLDVEGVFQTSPFFAKDSELPGKPDMFIGKLELQSLIEELLEIRGNSELSIKRLALNQWDILPQGEIFVLIKRFKNFSRNLNQVALIVPAPLNQLDGTVELKVGGEIRTTPDLFQVPVELKTHLKSANQVAEIEISGSATLDRPYQSRMHIDLNTLIKGLKLELPPLDPLSGIPRVFPDERFKKIVAKPKEKKIDGEKVFELTYSLTVNTLNEPIYLLYNLFHPYAPMRPVLSISSENGTTGQIDLQKFKVEYLRRKSEVEHLRMALNNDPEGAYPLNGRLRVEQTNYTVFIDILGTLKSPNIVLSSEPYLEKSDIISVLLYDKVSDDLAGADREQVGGFESAIADKAIGLFGIWAFAATPLKSFSYNQNTKMYSANLKVADGTTVTIGTDWENQTNFEVRRKLTDRWMVVAVLQPDAKGAQTGKILLQWERRY